MLTRRALLLAIGGGSLAVPLAVFVKDMLAQPVPPNYFHPKSNELATAFGEAVVGYLYGKGQSKALLDDAAGKMDRILKD